MLEQHSGTPQWSQFVSAINKRFGPYTDHNHLRQLSTTQEIGELDDDNNRFILNLTKVRGLSSSQQVMLYTAGLASTLWIDTELKQPPDLETAMALA